MSDKKTLKFGVFAVLSICLLLGVGLWAHNQSSQNNEQSAASSDASPAQGADRQTAETKEPPAVVKPSMAKTAKGDQHGSHTRDTGPAAEDTTAAGIETILSLRKQATEESVARLATFLDGDDPALLSEAIDALGTIALGDDELKEEIFRILAEKARDPDFTQKGSALVTAAMIGDGEKLLPLIAEFIAEPYEESKAMAARALSFAATPESVSLLDDIVKTSQDPKTQKNALAILSTIDTPEAFQILAQSLDAPAEETQAAGVWALSRQNDPRQNELLANALLEGKLSGAALAVLAQSPAASEIYGSTLQNEAIPKEDKINMLSILATNTVNASGSVRSSVAASVLPLLDSSDPEIQKAAIDTLKDVGAKENLAEALEPKLHSSDILVQEAALYAFAQYATPDTYKPLKELWYSEDEKIRRTAFFFSSIFVDESDLADLQKATEHEDQFISQQAEISIKFINQRIPQS
jgi:HEAT repeat protein